MVVVGIFGKSRINDEKLFKGYLFDDVTQRDVFTIQGQTSDDVTEGENEVKITGSLFTNIRNVLQWGSEN